MQHEYEQEVAASDPPFVLTILHFGLCG